MLLRMPVPHSKVLMSHIPLRLPPISACTGTSDLAHASSTRCLSHVAVCFTGLCPSLECVLQAVQEMLMAENKILLQRNESLQASLDANTQDQVNHLICCTKPSSMCVLAIIKWWYSQTPHRFHASTRRFLWFMCHKHSQPQGNCECRVLCKYLVELLRTTLDQW